MNLVNANLKTVNTSRPELIHSISQQSVTASDDFYSASSNESSTSDRTTIVRYQTPPSHMRSAYASRDVLHEEPHILSAREIEPLRLTPGSRPTGVKFEHSITRKPVTSEGTAWRQAPAGISPPTPGVDDTPFIQFAIEQLTRDEELLGRRRDDILSEISTDAIIYDKRVDQQDQGYSYDGRSSRHDRPRSEPPQRRPDTPFINDVFRPVEPQEDPFRYPRLNFVPNVLRLTSLGCLLVCCLLMTAALIFSTVWVSSHDGLLQYDRVGTSRYFLFEFIPQLLASVIIIWLLVIQNAIFRILPFSELASNRSTRHTGVLHDVVLFPSNYLIPPLSCFARGEPLLGTCFIVFWLSLFTVPLQSSLFQTRYYPQTRNGVWIWTTVQPVGWTLVTLYIVLSITVVYLIFRFSRHRTGLKWDADSLADILMLIQRSNVLCDFEGSETNEKIRKTSSSRNLRLGYWNTSARPNEVFYAIGEENAPASQYTLDRGKTRASDFGEKPGHPASLDLEGQRPLKTSTFDSTQADIHSSAVRYRWIPWFLRDAFVIAWIVIALILLIAFLVISFVNKAVQLGFLPLLPAETTDQGFSPANFLYSFVPSLIGMLLFLLWQPIDMYFRALQPFASLSNTRGSTAEQSILLDYPASLPVAVTFKAALAGHYKVAWISFISLLSITLPVLGGGIFTAQFFTTRQQVRLAASMPAYYALIVFLIIYALSFLVIRPGRKRHLPHDIRTLAEIISFVYQSPILDDATFREPRSKVDLVTRLIGDKGAPRYGFGVFMGRDRREHLGIDRVQRPGSGEMLITTGTMK